MRAVVSDRMMLRVAAGCGLLACSVGLSSCFLLPSRPDLSGPVSLTAVNGSLAFVQCVAPRLDAQAVNLALHDESKPDGETWLLISADSGGVPAAVIPAETPITEATLEGKLDRSGEENVKMSTLEGEVSVFVTITAEDVVVEQRFPSVHAADLVAGSYVYPSGEISSEPCGMPGAFQ